MRNKTNRGTKFPGFFECVNHDRLTIFLTDKPNTLCHSCFKRINLNLALYLAQTMANSFQLLNQQAQNTDMIEKILERVAQLEEKEQGQDKAKTKPEETEE